MLLTVYGQLIHVSAHAMRPRWQDFAPTPEKSEGYFGGYARGMMRGHERLTRPSPGRRRGARAARIYKPRRAYRCRRAALVRVRALLHFRRDHQLERRRHPEAEGVVHAFQRRSHARADGLLRGVFAVLLACGD